MSTNCEAFSRYIISSKIQRLWSISIPQRGQDLMPMIFRLSGSTALKCALLCHGNHCMGSGTLPAKSKMSNFQHLICSLCSIVIEILIQEIYTWLYSDFIYILHNIPAFFGTRVVSFKYLIVLTCPPWWDSTATMRPPESNML